MEPVRHGVVDVHGDGQDRPLPLPRVFAPGDHRGQVGAAVKDVHVKAAVPDPGQAGHVEGVGRHVGQVEVVQGGVPLPVRQKAAVERLQVRLQGRHQLHEGLPLRVEVGVVGLDPVPEDQLPLTVPAVPELRVGVEHLRHRPDHGGIEGKAAGPEPVQEPGHLHIHSQTHDAAQVIDKMSEHGAAVPGIQVHHRVGRGEMMVHKSLLKSIYYFRRRYQVRASQGTLLSAVLVPFYPPREEKSTAAGS